MESSGDFKIVAAIEAPCYKSKTEQHFQTGNLFNPYDTPMRRYYAIPILQMRKLSSGRLSNFPEVTQVVGDKAKI